MRQWNKTQTKYIQFYETCFEKLCTDVSQEVILALNARKKKQRSEFIETVNENRCTMTTLAVVINVLTCN